MSVATCRAPAPDQEHDAELRPRFRDLLAAEWIKLRSLRSTWVAYGATAVAVIAFNVGTAYDTYNYWPQQDANRARFVRDGIPLQEAFTANAAVVMMIALGALGAIAVIGEYSTGTIRTTFAAVPARRSVFAAKAAAVTAATTVFGLLVAGISFWLTQAILGTCGVGVSLGAPHALRVVLASAMLAPVCALTGMALGTVIRQTASTMIAAVVIIVVLPMVFTDGRHWSATVGHAMPHKAWIRLVEVNHQPQGFPWTLGGAWTVFAVWALAATAVAIAGVHRRDQ
ncbi:ABC transporter permease [Streptomyces sp. NPDC055239]